MKPIKAFLKKTDLAIIQWPQECATCGKQADKKYLLMSNNFGLMKGDFERLKIPLVPYCQSCHKKVNIFDTVGNLSQAVVFGAYIIFLILYFAYLTREGVFSGVGPIRWFAYTLGTSVLAGFITSVVLVWVPLIIINFIIRNFIKPVTAKLHGENQLVIAFPSNEYAVKFYLLNRPFMAGDSSIDFEAELRKAEKISAGEVCWFCQEHRVADGKPYKIILKKDDGKIEKEKVIWVPRCSVCEKAHAEPFCMGNFLLGLIFLGIIGSCFVIGILGKTTLGFWSWVIGLIISMVGVIAFFVILFSAGKLREKKAGTRSAVVARIEYTGVQELIKQGWVVESGNKPS